MNIDATTEVPLVAPASLRQLQNAIRAHKLAFGPVDYGNLLGHECLDDAEEWLEKVLSKMLAENSRRNVHDYWHHQRKMQQRWTASQVDGTDETPPF
jgi:hypothetical protein